MKLSTRVWLAKDRVTRIWPEKAFLAFVWALPKKVVYWSVVRAAVNVEPNYYPGEVTAMQMMKGLEA